MLSPSQQADVQSDYSVAESLSEPTEFCYSYRSYAWYAAILYLYYAHYRYIHLFHVNLLGDVSFFKVQYAACC